MPEGIPTDLHGYFISEYIINNKSEIKFNDNGSLRMSIESDVKEYFNQYVDAYQLPDATAVLRQIKFLNTNTLLNSKKLKVKFVYFDCKSSNINLKPFEYVSIVYHLYFLFQIIVSIIYNNYCMCIMNYLYLNL